ncbi:MAG: cyclic nucleotide-binding domain-containing protein [Sulfurimonas sp.]
MTRLWKNSAEVVLFITLIFSVPFLFFFDDKTALIWTIIVPPLPLIIILIGFSNWRNICPLATVSKISQKLNLNNKRKVPKWFEKNFYSVQYFALYAALVFRMTTLNFNDFYLILFFIFIFVSAFVTNLIFTGKSWCNFFCPVGVVERIYCVSNAKNYDHNSACPTCTACKKNCPDIDMESNYWKEKENKQKSFVFYSFPGMILGFYLYFYLQSGSFEYYFSGNWTHDTLTLMSSGFFFATFIPIIIAAPLALALFSVISYYLFKSSEILLWKMKIFKELTYTTFEHRMKVTAAFVAFNTFYAFAGAPSYQHHPILYTIFYFLVIFSSTVIFYKEIFREENYFIQERFALKIIKKWNYDKTIPANLTEIYYTYINDNKDDEKRLNTYKESIRELLKDGILDENSEDVIEQLRTQVGISKKDHFNVMRTIKLNNEHLFDKNIEKSSEKSYQIQSYKEMILEALNSHEELDINYIKSLQKQFRISDDLHKEIMHSLFNTDEKIHSNIIQLAEKIEKLIELQNFIYDDGSREIHYLKYAIRAKFGLVSRDLFSLLFVIYKDNKDTLNTLIKIAKGQQIPDTFELSKETLSFMDDDIAEKLLCLRMEFTAKSKQASKNKNKNILTNLLSHESIQIASAALLALHIKYPKLALNVNFEPFTECKDAKVSELAYKIQLNTQKLTILERMMYLNDVTIFHNLTFHELQLLAESTTLQEFIPKHYIIEQGGVGDTLFIILSGKASVQKDGKQINIISNKDYFGDVAILGDIKRTVSVKTISELTALTISKTVFQRFLDENPKTHNELMKTIIKKLVDMQAK